MAKLVGYCHGIVACEARQRTPFVATGMIKYSKLASSKSISRANGKNVAEYLSWIPYQHN